MNKDINFINILEQHNFIKATQNNGKGIERNLFLSF